MNPLFERLSLQGHLRRIIEQWGPEQGWQIIRAAVERELAHALREKDHDPATPH